MQRYINNVAGPTGAPVANASVQVNLYPSGASAAIYSDNGVTHVSNPLTTDQNGAFSFYAADGHYQLVISGANIVSATLNDIILLDIVPADLPTSLPASAGVTWNNGGVLSVS
jgi:hypothetical protein